MAKSNIKKASKAELEKCENKLNFGACEKVNRFCSGGDTRACISMALYWQKQGDSETMLSFIKMGCEKGDSSACEIYGKMYTKQVESQSIKERINQLETRQRDEENEYRQQQLEIDRQNARTNAVNAFSNSVNMWNQQQNPPQPKRQRCRTAVRPGNEFHGTTATFETVCD